MTIEQFKEQYFNLLTALKKTYLKEESTKEFLDYLEQNTVDTQYLFRCINNIDYDDDFTLAYDESSVLHSILSKIRNNTPNYSEYIGRLLKLVSIERDKEGLDCIAKFTEEFLETRDSSFIFDDTTSQCFSFSLDTGNQHETGESCNITSANTRNITVNTEDKKEIVTQDERVLEQNLKIVQQLCAGRNLSIQSLKEAIDLLNRNSSNADSTEKGLNFKIQETRKVVATKAINLAKNIKEELPGEVIEIIDLLIATETALDRGLNLKTPLKNNSGQRTIAQVRETINEIIDSSLRNLTNTGTAKELEDFIAKLIQRSIAINIDTLNRRVEELRHVERYPVAGQDDEEKKKLDVLKNAALSTLGRHLKNYNPDAKDCKSNVKKIQKLAEEIFKIVNIDEDFDLFMTSVGRFSNQHIIAPQLSVMLFSLIENVNKAQVNDQSARDIKDVDALEKASIFATKLKVAQGRLDNFTNKFLYQVIKGLNRTKILTLVSKLADVLPLNAYLKALEELDNDATKKEAIQKMNDFAELIPIVIRKATEKEFDSIISRLAKVKHLPSIFLRSILGEYIDKYEDAHKTATTEEENLKKANQNFKKFSQTSPPQNALTEAKKVVFETQKRFNVAKKTESEIEDQTSKKIQVLTEAFFSRFVVNYNVNDLTALLRMLKASKTFKLDANVYSEGIGLLHGMHNSIKGDDANAVDRRSELEMKINILLSAIHECTVDLSDKRYIEICSSFSGKGHPQITDENAMCHYNKALLRENDLLCNCIGSLESQNKDLQSNIQGLNDRVSCMGNDQAKLKSITLATSISTGIFLGTTISITILHFVRKLLPRGDNMHRITAGVGFVALCGLVFGSIAFVVSHYVVNSVVSPDHYVNTGDAWPNVTGTVKDSNPGQPNTTQNKGVSSTPSTTTNVSSTKEVRQPVMYCA